MKEKLGYLPALGDVEYSISLSREDGLELSVSAPELQNSKIELSKGVGMYCRFQRSGGGELVKKREIKKNLLDF